MSEGQEVTQEQADDTHYEFPMLLFGTLLLMQSSSRLCRGHTRRLREVSSSAHITQQVSPECVQWTPEFLLNQQHLACPHLTEDGIRAPTCLRGQRCASIHTPR